MNESLGRQCLLRDEVTREKGEKWGLTMFATLSPWYAHPMVLFCDGDELCVDTIVRSVLTIMQPRAGWLD